MKNFRIILLFIICLISHLSYAGPFWRSLNKKTLDFLQSIEPKLIANTVVPIDELRHVNPSFSGKIDPSLASLHAYKYLNLLSKKELISRMQKRASELSIQHLSTENGISNVDLLNFNLFLELESSGTHSQQALAKAIIHLAQIEHYLAELKVPLFKVQKAKVNYHHWMILVQNLTEEEIDVQKRWFYKITSERLKDSSMSALKVKLKEPSPDISFRSKKPRFRSKKPSFKFKKPK